jgi:hypothetical protein
VGYHSWDVPGNKSKLLNGSGAAYKFAKAGRTKEEKKLGEQFVQQLAK